MNARWKILPIVLVEGFAISAGGCSRHTYMFVRNQCSFVISVHERVEWQSVASVKDSGPIAPQGVFLLTVSRGESIHLVVTNAAGKVLSRGTVPEATVNAAYWKHVDISADVIPGHIRVSLEEVDFANPSNNWRLFGLVAAGLIVPLIAFRFYQKR